MKQQSRFILKSTSSGDHLVNTLSHTTYHFHSIQQYCVHKITSVTAEVC